MPGVNYGSQFDDFLYAPIGEESNGMQLSVLSALARQNVDPWEEAAMLTRLPGETAMRKLAALIAALPNGPAARIDPETIAARLVALLPERPVEESRLRAAYAQVRAAGHEPAQQQQPAAKRSAFGGYMWLYAAFMVVLLVIQWLGAERQPAPADTPTVAHKTPSLDP